MYACMCAPCFLLGNNLAPACIVFGNLALLLRRLVIKVLAKESRERFDLRGARRVVREVFVFEIVKTFCSEPGVVGVVVELFSNQPSRSPVRLRFEIRAYINTYGTTYMHTYMFTVIHGLTK